MLILFFYHLSHVIRKPVFAYAKSKGADQLHCNCAAHQHFCFCYIVSTVPLQKFQALVVQPGLFQTWSETGFSMSHFSILIFSDLHANNLARLTSRSFRDLPSLIELRLHSQKTPMTSIAYDAWSNIGTELVYL